MPSAPEAFPSAIVVAFITSSLSLIGIVASQTWSAIAQRRADERKAVYERKKDENEIQRRIMVLRATLRTELYKLVTTFDDEIKFVSAPKYPYTWVPIGDFFSSFEKTKSELGFLTIEEVEAVVDAYFSFQEQVGYVARNGDFKLDPVRSIGYSLDNEDKRIWLIDALKKIVATARVAVDALDKATGRPAVLWREDTRVSAAGLGSRKTTA